jgi:hypothetical protein
MREDGGGLRRVRALDNRPVPVPGKGDWLDCERHPRLTGGERETHCQAESESLHYEGHGPRISTSTITSLRRLGVVDSGAPLPRGYLP